MTKNEILEELMDLQNNKIGRDLFLCQNESKMDETVHFLIKMSEKAVKIHINSDFVNHKYQMVYIDE